MNIIQQTGIQTFELTNRGHHMTLTWENSYGWAMYTVNASVQAYNRGVAIPKYFATLHQVERQYKSWVGISVLASNAVGVAQ